MRICADTTWIDDFLKDVSPGATISLGQGTVKTHGNWAFPDWRRSVKDGVTIEGQGLDSRIILEDPKMTTSDGSGRPNNDCNILWCGYDVTLRNLTLDANALNLDPKLNVGGVRFHGRFTMENVDIVGLRGTDHTKDPTGKGVEVFGWASEGDTGGSIVRNVRVRECVPTSYASGGFLGCYNSTRVVTERSIVEDCDNDMGEGNWFAYSAHQKVDFVRCTGKNVAHFFHNDYKANFDNTMVDCSGSARTYVASCISTEPNLRRELVIRGGRFDSPGGVELWDQTGKGMPGGVLLVRVDLRNTSLLASVVSKDAVVTAYDCVLGQNPEYLRGRGPGWESPFGMTVRNMDSAGGFVDVRRRWNE